MMDKADRHVYLYAKGHYQKGDVVEDLQQVFSERNGIDPEFISDKDIVIMLLAITYPHMVNQSQFIDFIADLHPSEYWKFCATSQEYTFSKAVIRKCLSILMMTRVKEFGEILMDLGEPDPAILPLTKRVPESEKI